MADGRVTGGIDDIYVAAGLAGDVEALSVRCRGHPLGLLTYRDDVLHFTGSDVDHAGCLDVFVGDVELGAVLAEGKLFRVRTRGYLARQFLFRNIHDADRVGRFIGFDAVVVVVLALLEDGIAFGIQLRRRRYGSAAQGHIHRFTVRTGVDTARTLADRNRAEHSIVTAVDDGDIPRFLVGHVDLIILTRLRRQRRYGGQQAPQRSKTIQSSDASTRHHRHPPSSRPSYRPRL